MAPAETADQSLRFAEFELQPSTGRLLRNGRPVAIEPKAFDLLLLLARERGRLVEKEEILEAVWNGTFVTDNALTRTVTRLRKSLGDSAREPRFVETVHTRGYRFLAEVEVVSGPVAAPAEQRGWRRRYLQWVVAAAAVVLLALALAWLVPRPGPEQPVAQASAELDRRRGGPTQRAYELYLKGRQAYTTRTRVGNEEALAFYNAALEIDPDFALAEAGRANALATRSIHYKFDPENEEEAVRAAERALALNPELPEAHKALGIVALRQDRMADAIRHNRKALELNPSYDEALYNLSSALHMTGQWHEALRIQLRETSLPVSRQALAAQLLQLGLVAEGRRLAEQALSESPLPAYLTVHLALEDARGGDFEAARQRLAALQNARPELSGVWEVSAAIEAVAGDRLAAAGYFERAQVAWGDREAEALTDLARAAWLRGDTEATGRLCDELEGKLRPHIDEGSEFWFHPWAMALVAAMRGDLEASVEWYEQAVDLGYRRHWPDEVMPVFEALRRDPRFQAQLERMRRSVEEMREAVRDEVARAVERLTAS